MNNSKTKIIIITLLLVFTVSLLTSCTNTEELKVEDFILTENDFCYNDLSWNSSISDVEKAFGVEFEEKFYSDVDVDTHLYYDTYLLEKEMKYNGSHANCLLDFYDEELYMLTWMISGSEDEINELFDSTIEDITEKFGASTKGPREIINDSTNTSSTFEDIDLYSGEVTFVKNSMHTMTSWEKTNTTIEVIKMGGKEYTQLRIYIYLNDVYY